MGLGPTGASAAMILPPETPVIGTLASEILTLGAPLLRPSPGSSAAASRAAPRFLVDTPPLAVLLLAFRRSGTGWLLSRTTGAPAEPGHGAAARRARHVRRPVRHRAQAAAVCRRLLVRRLCVQA